MCPISKDTKKVNYASGSYFMLGNELRRIL